ncbi:MAG: holdfast anchor protein HfaD [Caulobacteraceae bacterium]
MPVPVKTLAVGTLVVLLAQPLLCGVATSQTVTDGRVINGQVQFGDVFSTQLLSVEDAADGVRLNTDATGNAVTARSVGAKVFDSGQTLLGYSSATSSGYVAGSVRRPYDVQATANGNTAVVSTRDGPLTGESTQIIGENAGPAAAAYNGVDGQAGIVDIGAMATGNSQTWQGLRGRVGSTTQQINHNVTQAKAEAELWRADDVRMNASAQANTMVADVASGDADLAGSQVMAGYRTEALADVHIYDVGYINVSTDAVANTIDAAADGGIAGLVSNQTNIAPVNAQSTVTAKYFDQAEAHAYGVGNSASLLNVGPKTEMSNIQNNGGEVVARATFDGAGGRDVTTSATAIGNMVSGYNCTECGGVMQAGSSQISTANVSAVTSTSLARGRVRTVSGTSSAVGNSASFVVQSGN